MRCAGGEVEMRFAVHIIQIDYQEMVGFGGLFFNGQCDGPHLKGSFSEEQKPLLTVGGLIGCPPKLFGEDKYNDWCKDVTKAILETLKRWA